jgi:hypothetical protein
MKIDLELAIPGVVSLYVFLQTGQIVSVDGELAASRAVLAICHCESAGQGTGEFLGRYEYDCQLSPLVFSFAGHDADRSFQRETTSLRAGRQASLPRAT